MMAIRMRLTVTVEYVADPEHYGTDDPAAMAALDQATAEQDPAPFLDGVGDVSVRVEVL